MQAFFLLIKTVRRLDMPQLPRLPPVRRHNRPRSIPPRPSTSIRYLPYRAGCSMAGKSSLWTDTEGQERGNSSKLRCSTEELQFHLVHCCILPQRERRRQSIPGYQVRLLRYTPSGYRHALRAPRSHCLPQVCLVCSHQSRSPPCLLAPQAGRPTTRALQILSIPAKHQHQQSLLFLVGAHARLPTRLSPDKQHPMGFRLQAAG